MIRETLISFPTSSFLSSTRFLSVCFCVVCSSLFGSKDFFSKQQHRDMTAIVVEAIDKGCQARAKRKTEMQKQKGALAKQAKLTGKPQKSEGSDDDGDDDEDDDGDKDKDKDDKEEEENSQ